jgi:xanthine dehydrogenase YagT iron-sulfur-binding subunit
LESQARKDVSHEHVTSLESELQAVVFETLCLSEVSIFQIDCARKATRKGTDMQTEKPGREPDELTRREFVGAAVLLSGIVEAPLLEAQPGQAALGHTSCSLSINNVRHDLSIDSRVTLLDLLREQLHLTGTKKGCDHGQCGACTVIANGQRINSCLAFAVAHDGEKITTIEGLSHGDQLHPMQEAFLQLDAFQCGFCTSGQICSAVAMLDEAHSGAPSYVTTNMSKMSAVHLTEPEVRERMSGNICRCGAYTNIVAAVRAVDQRG